ncbi:Pvc16 family protein [Bradyrhizobium sp. 2S1]|uniref:Pvc16 family protein n=1 Tax=Bradyrhizobium sp. 2S1 TaxID=1404429 RepID=UPI0014098C5A|nr:Pvc16 family protein [Bradyrhizobium sp. 2S1]MCK7665047.1 DUF4255 domain-containing protein [Bradyrhizobium sp. 2S1]
MPIRAVTYAIRDLLRDALHLPGGPPPGPDTGDVYVGPPDTGKAMDELILFLMRITPNGELRNAERLRPAKDSTKPPERYDPAVPLDLHYLVTSGSPDNKYYDYGLTRLGRAIQAIESASPLSLPLFYQDAVWLSLDPMSSEELSRIWGLFPNFNCRTCFIFRASPVWIDPLKPVPSASSVIDRDLRGGALAETL